MTKQSRSLFDAPVASRHDDPETSRSAAKRMQDSHAAATQREKVLAALIQNPGSTAAELAALADMARHDPSRRLPELRLKGLAVNGSKRVCRITGNESLTWLPAGDAGTNDVSPATPNPAPPSPAAEISGEDLIDWFRDNRHRLPTEPFELGPGVRVTNPERFYAALEADIAAGPTGKHFSVSIPRARWSPLLGDLAALKRITEHLIETN